MAQTTGTRRSDRTGTSPGTVRALFTLAGVAGAGALIWAAQLADLDEAGGFWAAMAILVVAGFALGLSQLLGGWTKWGRPAFSPLVFLVAFVPTFIVALWIVLTEQPESGWGQGRFSDWSGDLGIEAFVNDVGVFLSIVPVIVGLVLAFSFDTTGPPVRVIEKLPADGQESVVEELRRRRDEEQAEPDEPMSEEDEHAASLSQGT